MEKAKDELIQKSRLYLIVLVLPESDPYFLGRKPTVTYHSSYKNIRCVEWGEVLIN